MEEQKEVQNTTVEQTTLPSVDKSVQQQKHSLFFVWLGIGGVLLGLLGWFSYQQLFVSMIAIPDKTALDALPTYFSYTPEELQQLENTDPPKELTTTKDLYNWEKQAYEIVAENQSVDVYASKVYAYLLVARRDQLLLTRSMVKDFRGDTSAISKKVLCTFYPDSCSGIIIENSDTFSEKLSDIIIQKVKQRIVKDADGTKNYSLKEGQDYWQSTEPPIGLDAGSYLPWALQKGDQFRVPEYADFTAKKFDTQFTQAKNALFNITSDQRKAVVYWAGGPGTKTPPGIWLDLSGEYMLEKQVSVEKYIDTQALLAIAMADAVIAVFDSKYTYQIKRPFMLDQSIKTIMPTPNHPSYPAGHSVISSAALAVLDAMLPDNSKEWQRMAKEAGLSRVWGGIHYPVDDEQGTILGQRVGVNAVTYFNQQ